jgi:hypothetical protein
MPAPFSGRNCASTVKSRRRGSCPRHPPPTHHPFRNPYLPEIVINSNAPPDERPSSQRTARTLAVGPRAASAGRAGCPGRQGAGEGARP